MLNQKNKLNEDYVEIEYEGKKFVGKINSVQSVLEETYNTLTKSKIDVLCYSVSLIDKETNCIISNINIKHFSDIKTYKGE